MKASKYALIVGVGGDLAVTERDARAFHARLIDEQRGGFPSANVELLVQDGATKSQLVEGLSRLVDVANADPLGNVIIYYSGHGGYFSDATGNRTYYLVPHGFTPDDPAGTGLTDADFTSLLSVIKSKRVVVFLDCCHAGGIPLLKGRRSTFEPSSMPSMLAKLVANEAARGGLVVVGSSLEAEYSYVGDRLSIFTECLLEAFDGHGQKNEDGQVRILDTLSYLLDTVPGRAPGPQHPLVKKVLDLSSNFVLGRYESSGGSKRSGARIGRDFESSLSERLRQGIEAAVEIHEEKIALLRQQAATVTDVLVRFEAQQRLLAEEAALSALIEKMADLDEGSRQEGSRG